MNEERRNQESSRKDNLSFWQKFGLICLAVVIAAATILVINL